MARALRMIKRAIALWWREVILLSFFNVVWFVLQIPIITGPPATAAMYVIVRRMQEDELLHPLDGWSALRHVFWPAWKWAGANLILVTVLLINLWGYWQTPGEGWAIVRLLWIAIAFGWFTLNLFYWPFWLVQSDQRMANTYRNSLALLLTMPAPVLTLAFTSAVLVASSILLSLPLVLGLMAWLALIGTLTVDEALREHRNAG